MLDQLVNGWFMHPLLLSEETIHLNFTLAMKPLSQASKSKSKVKKNIDLKMGFSVALGAATRSA